MVGGGREGSGSGSRRLGLIVIALALGPGSCAFVLPVGRLAVVVAAGKAPEGAAARSGGGFLPPKKILEKVGSFLSRATSLENNVCSEDDEAAYPDAVTVATGIDVDDEVVDELGGEGVIVNGNERERRKDLQQSGDSSSSSTGSLHVDAGEGGDEENAPPPSPSPQGAGTGLDDVRPVRRKRRSGNVNDGGGGGRPPLADESGTLDIESQFVESALNALQGQVASIGDALRVTADTLAGAAGGSMKTVGATVRTVGSVLDSAAVAATSRPGAPTTRSQTRQNAGPDPVGGVMGLGRNAVAGVLKLTSTGVRGLGDAVFQAGTVAEGLASGTGQVAEDIVRVFEGSIGSLKNSLAGGEQHQYVMVGRQPSHTPRPGQKWGEDSSSPPSSPLLDGAAGEGAAHTAEGSVGDLPEGQAWGSAGLVLEGLRGIFVLLSSLLYFLLEPREGVPSLSLHLGCGLFLHSWILLKVRRRRWRLILTTMLWAVIMAISQTHRRRLVATTQAEVYRRVSTGIERGSESVIWANRLVDRMWMGGERGGLGAYMSQMARESASESLQETAPDQAAQIQIHELELGSRPPLVLGVEVIDPAEARMNLAEAAALGATLHLRTEILMDAKDMSVVCAVKMSSLERAMLPTGIMRLSELVLSATMVLSIQVLPAYPFIGLVWAGFESIPEVDIHLTGAGLDVMTMGSIDSWLRMALRESLKAYTLPNFTTYDMGAAAAAAITAQADSECEEQADDADFTAALQRHSSSSRGAVGPKTGILGKLSGSRAGMAVRKRMGAQSPPSSPAGGQSLHLSPSSL